MDTRLTGEDSSPFSVPSNISVIAALRDIVPDGQLSLAEQQRYTEQQSERLLELARLTAPPVPFGLIGGLPRVEVEVIDGLLVHGLALWIKDRWVIPLAGQDTRTRQRDTLAHQFKHILDFPFFDRLYTSPNGITDHSQAEAMADYFSMCVRMPRDWILRAWHRGQHDADELSRLFRVSSKGMAVRLWQLGITGWGPTCGLRVRSSQVADCGPEGAMP